MKAKYQQRCGLCEHDIMPGDEIAEVDDEWCHRVCADEDADAAAEAHWMGRYEDA